MKLLLRFDSGKARDPRLNSWQLLLAIAVVGVIAVAVLWLTPAPEVVQAVLAALVQILGG
jgi:hypothetical protein